MPAYVAMLELAARLRWERSTQLASEGLACAGAGPGLGAASAAIGATCPMPRWLAQHHSPAVLAQSGSMAI